MAEPLTTAVILSAVAGGAVGSATQEVVRQGTEAVVDWIRSYLGKHGAEAKRRAEENAAELLVEIATRVTRVEERLRQLGKTDEEILQRLSDPDFAAALHHALIAGARTDSRPKHELLAGMVADRLAARSESVEAVTASSAVETIPRLAPVHLELLGLLATLHAIRPGYLVGTTAEQMAEQLPGDLDRFITPIESIVDVSRGPEMGLRQLRSFIRHLASLGCVVRSASGKSTIAAAHLFSSALRVMKIQQVEEVVRAWPHGEMLEFAWRDCLSTAELTPVGHVIGVAVSHQKRRPSRRP